jgi:hypothetical protein
VETAEMPAVSPDHRPDPVGRAGVGDDRHRVTRATGVREVGGDDLLAHHRVRRAGERLGVGEAVRVELDDADRQHAEHQRGGHPHQPRPPAMRVPTRAQNPRVVGSAEPYLRLDRPEDPPAADGQQLPAGASP